MVDICSLLCRCKETHFTPSVSLKSDFLPSSSLNGFAFVWWCNCALNPKTNSRIWVGVWGNDILSRLRWRSLCQGPDGKKQRQEECRDNFFSWFQQSLCLSSDRHDLFYLFKRFFSNCTISPMIQNRETWLMSCSRTLGKTEGMFGNQTNKLSVHWSKGPFGLTEFSIITATCSEKLRDQLLNCYTWKWGHS